MSTTWLSSAKMTYVSESKTLRQSLSRSGRLSGQTRRLFGADFGFGIPKCNSIPTGPSHGSVGANLCATSATRRRQVASPFAADVITGLPLTTQDRAEPCGTGRPCTWNVMTASERNPPASETDARPGDTWAVSVVIRARAFGGRLAMSHPHLRGSGGV